MNQLVIMRFLFDAVSSQDRCDPVTVSQKLAGEFKLWRIGGPVLRPFNQHRVRIERELAGKGGNRLTSGR
jgi:hypothetical protein